MEEFKNFIRENIVQVGIGLLTLLVIILVIIFRHPPQQQAGSEESSKYAGRELVTRAPIPPGTVLPSPTSTNVPSNVAKPTRVQPELPGAPIDSRSFAGISISNGKFSPDTVIVRVNDVVNLPISAIDRTYTWSQPDLAISYTINKGTTWHAQFQPYQTGKFSFFCSGCSAPGTLIVVPK